MPHVYADECASNEILNASCTLSGEVKRLAAFCADGTAHCHINNGLMDIGFSAVVAIVELGGFQTEFTAIELAPELE